MSKKQGFSLVELLVSIAVIGVLAAISLQTFQKYRESAFRANVVVTANNIITAAQAIVDDMPVGSSSTMYNYSASMWGAATTMTENKTNYTKAHNGLAVYMRSLQSNSDPSRLRYSLSITKGGGFGAGHQIYLPMRDCRLVDSYVKQMNIAGHISYWINWGVC